MCPSSWPAAARSPRPAASLLGVRRALPCLIALVLLQGCGGDDDPAPTADQTALADALKGGGVAIVFRHAMTENTTDREEIVGDCTTQRNLSEDGRAQARQIGRDVEALGVPVEEVLASPMCRTFETAELAFGEAERSAALLSAGEDATPADDRRIARLKELATAPDGSVTAIVTHTGNIGGAFDQSVEEGDAVVVRDGEVLGVVAPDDWKQLAEAGG
jgi:phosphohistidine phosphatase SixA